MRFFVFFLLAVCCVATNAQTPPPSPEVHADGSVTFRLAAPAAKQVILSSDALATHTLPMERDASGVWRVTIPPVAPQIYSYSFVADGAAMPDPHNPHTKPNLLGPGSELLVPGTPPMPWELTAIPHGRVDRHVYTTHVALHLPQDQEPYYVYTPPAYDASHKGAYPVLYLLHGWSDGADGWDAVGRAGLILDSLIAGGKAVPMIVVMPLGYGDYNFVLDGFGVWNEPAKVQANVDLFDRMLTTEIMPAVEQAYATAKGRDNTAIAGLSMGGLESLTIGLRYPARFAFVGGFSSAVFHEGFDTIMPALDAKAPRPRLLWVACGTDDHLIKPNRDFVLWARANGLPVTPVETPGAHTWLVWRDNLIHFAPLLFRK